MMKRRVVFVDDERNVLNAFRRMLERQSELWEMVFLESADKVLHETKSHEVDVIISDIRMPGMDGFELLRQLKVCEQTKDIPVVIVTGNHEEDLKRHALDLGATDLLSKPVNTEDLIARVQSALRLKSHQDTLKNQNEILEQKVKERTADLVALTSKLEESRLEIIWRLGKAGEYRDEETGNHVIRMGCYCRPISEALGMGSEFAELIVLAAPLHDIGKIGIPDGILLKAGKLTPKEWDVMRTHPAIGAAILRHDSKMMRAFAELRSARGASRLQIDEHPVLSMASSIALNHHEKWDGSGYPNRLAGDVIPLEARIVALADVYDALVSDRCYRAAVPEAEVLRMMQENVGLHFDPVVHKAFEKSLNEIRSIRERFSDEKIPGSQFVSDLLEVSAAVRTRHGAADDTSPR
jgi:putative two-component system response regulator